MVSRSTFSPWRMRWPPCLRSSNLVEGSAAAAGAAAARAGVAAASPVHLDTALHAVRGVGRTGLGGRLGHRRGRVRVEHAGPLQPRQHLFAVEAAKAAQACEEQAQAARKAQEDGIRLEVRGHSSDTHARGTA